MSVNTLIPVNKALYVDHVAGRQFSKCLVNVGVGAGEVGLNAEIVINVVFGEGNVDIVAGSAVLVFNALNGKTGE